VALINLLDVAFLAVAPLLVTENLLLDVISLAVAPL